MHTQTILGAFSCRSGGQLEGGTWDESSTHTHTQQAQHSAQNQHVQKSQAGVGYGTAAKHVVAAMRAGRQLVALREQGWIGASAVCLPITCPNRRTGATSRREPTTTTTMPRTATVYWTRCGPINCSDQPRHPVPSSTDYKQGNTTRLGPLACLRVLPPLAARPIGNRRGRPRRETSVERCAALPRPALPFSLYPCACRVVPVRRGAPRSRSGRTQRDILFYFIFTNITKSSIINVLDLPS